MARRTVKHANPTLLGWLIVVYTQTQRPVERLSSFSGQVGLRITQRRVCRTSLERKIECVAGDGVPAKRLALDLSLVRNARLQNPTTLVGTLLG